MPILGNLLSVETMEHLLSENIFFYNNDEIGINIHMANVNDGSLLMPQSHYTRSGTRAGAELNSALSMPGPHYIVKITAKSARKIEHNDIFIKIIHFSAILVQIFN